MEKGTACGAADEREERQVEQEGEEEEEEESRYGAHSEAGTLRGTLFSSFGTLAIKH